MLVILAPRFFCRWLCVVSLLLTGSAAVRAQAPGGAAETLSRDGDVAFERRQYKDAIAAYGKLVQSFPNSEFAVDARFHLAYANFLIGQYDPAADDLRKLLGSPATPTETLELAALLLPQVLAQQAAALPAGNAKRQGGFESAIREYDAFIGKYPKSTSLESALYGRAVAAYQIARYDAAARDLQQAIAAFPTSDTVLDSTFLLAVTVATQANLSLARDQPTPADTDAAIKGYARAEGLLGDIIGKGTDISLANDAQFQLGETLAAHANALPGGARQAMYERALAAYRAVEPTEGMIAAQTARVQRINEARIAALRQGVPGRPLARQLDERRLREQGKLEALQAKEDPVLAARVKSGAVYYDLQRFDETRVLLTTLLPAIRKPEDEKLALLYIALSYAGQKNVAKAVPAYDRFQAKFSGDPVGENLPFVMGELFATAPKPDPARANQYFDELAKLYPKSRLRETALLAAAANADQLGHYDEALRSLDTFLRGKPRRELVAAAEQTRAVVLKDKKDYDGALAAFKKVRDTYKDLPEGEEGAFWVGWTLLQKHDYPGAIAELKAFAVKFPQSRLLPSALSVLGQAQQDSGAKDQALATLADVSARFPQSPEATAAYFARANLYLADRKNDEVVRVLTEFADKHPESDQSYAAVEQIAAVQAQANQTEAAAATYEKFLAQQPNSPHAAGALGKLAGLWLRTARGLGSYIVLGTPQRETWKTDLGKSIAASEGQLEKYPDAPETALGLRDLLDAQRLLIEAKVKTPSEVHDYFQALADKYENNPGARGRILFRLAALTAEKDPAQALADMKAAYDPAVVYSPADIDLFTGGLLPGDPDTAAAAFDKLARDYPLARGVPPAQQSAAVQEAQALAVYGRGEIARIKGDAAGATRAFTELKRDYPRSSKLAEANLGLAQGLIAQGKPDDALPLLAEVAKNPRSPLPVRAHGLFLNGEIQAAKGNVEAIDAYLKVAAFYPTAPDAPEGLWKGAQLLEKQANTLSETPAKPGGPTRSGQLARARKAYNDLATKYADFAVDAAGQGASGGVARNEIAEAASVWTAAKEAFDRGRECGQTGQRSPSPIFMSTRTLEGKVGLVFGVANKRSIAWGIAQAWAAAGAKLIFSYQGERLKANLEELMEDLGQNTPFYPCDVSSDESIAEFYKNVRSQTDRVDLVLHSVAFAPREALEGDFLSTTRDAFRMSHDVSAYSLVALARESAPLMTAGGSIISMTYHGSTKVVPRYNVMGVAKASLEAAARYLAYDLGKQKVRVNCVSAGPMNTLAARGISGLNLMMRHYQERAPLNRSCTLEELGAMGVFLASDGAASITGQVLYVDGGYEIMGM